MNSWVASASVVGSLHTQSPPSPLSDACPTVSPHVQGFAQARCSTVPSGKHLVTQGIAELGDPAQHLFALVDCDQRAPDWRCFVSLTATHAVWPNPSCAWTLGPGVAAAKRRRPSRQQQSLGWHGSGAEDQQRERRSSEHTERPWRRPFSSRRPKLTVPASPRCSASETLRVLSWCDDAGEPFLTPASVGQEVYEHWPHVFARCDLGDTAAAGLLSYVAMQPTLAEDWTLRVAHARSLMQYVVRLRGRMGLATAFGPKPQMRTMSALTSWLWLSRTRMMSCQRSWRRKQQRFRTVRSTSSPIRPTTWTRTSATLLAIRSKGAKDVVADSITGAQRGLVVGRRIVDAIIGFGGPVTTARLLHGAKFLGVLLDFASVSSLSHQRRMGRCDSHRRCATWSRQWTPR